jgi:AAA domain
MMQYSPTLIVGRVVVQRDKATVYDERLHPGVNIIRGDNSSGKSTILNFIFYGLGGDLTDWSDIALDCSHTIVEVSLNGLTVTLKREISSSPGRPMDIFPGDYDASVLAPSTEWDHYSYKRTEKLESFSQALFRLLGIPEVTNDETGISQCTRFCAFCMRINSAL